MFKNQNVLFGGGIFIALLSIGLGWYFFLRPKNPTVKALTNNENKNHSAATNHFQSSDKADVEDNDEEIEDESEEIITEVTDKKSDSAVLDEEESDDEDQEETLKQAYEDALRLAKKFLAGNQFTKAANKFSDAIDLADKIPSAAKDIVTLYNNRR